MLTKTQLDCTALDKSMRICVMYMIRQTIFTHAVQLLPCWKTLTDDSQKLVPLRHPTERPKDRPLNITEVGAANIILHLFPVPNIRSTIP